jgi:secreted trypsin-like serine protease
MYVGFPGIEPDTLCLFSGNISARQTARYLIDGVAIHGVSGGPVIHLHGSGLRIVGVVSHYRANRLAGDPLPGLLYAQDVSHFHEVIKEIRSLEEGQRKKQQVERK